MQLIIIHSGNQQHSYMHAFNMFIISLTEKIVEEVKMGKITYLIRTRSATSYIAATFHPTIG